MSDQALPPVEHVLSRRDQIRTMFFNRKPKSKVIEIEGVAIELRQPPVSVVLGGQQSEDRALNMCKILMNYCYVPDSSEKVFDEADIETMKELPMDEAWMGLTNAVNELMEVAKQADEGKGSLKGSPSS